MQSQHESLVAGAEGETTTIQDSALQQLDKSLSGVITEFISTADFSGKAVSLLMCLHTLSTCACVVQGQEDVLHC